MVLLVGDNSYNRGEIEKKKGKKRKKNKNKRKRINK
jgi:hypothetical protein